jgi:hypothetical protein
MCFLCFLFTFFNQLEIVQTSVLIKKFGQFVFLAHNFDMKEFERKISPKIQF